MERNGASPLSASAINTGAAALGVRLTSTQAEALSQFASLLLRWNAVHNLTSIESPEQVLTHHLLDCLAIVPEIERLSEEAKESRVARVLDVGSGGGLPGIPLAVAVPSLHVTLVDKVQKKVAFLTQAKVELRLDNVDCAHAKVEALQPPAPFDLIVSRAFASLPEFVRSTQHLIAVGGWWCAMKGVLPQAELDDVELVSLVRSARAIRLDMPGLNAERHLIVMQAA